MDIPDLQVEAILEMACRIEKNGYRFYMDAHDRVSDPDVKKLLKDLALMEKQHEASFAALRKARMGSPDAAASEEVLAFCRDMADDHVFNTWKIGNEGVHTILLKALSAEKETIAFFSGMKLYVTEQSGRKLIGEVIREEMSHVRMLSRMIKDLA